MESQDPMPPEIIFRIIKIFFKIKNISQTKYFLTSCIVKVSLVNTLLILNSKSDSYKSKTFFNYKKRKKKSQDNAYM